MFNFLRITASPQSWIASKVQAVLAQYNKSVEARREQDLRRRYMNG